MEGERLRDLKKIVDFLKSRDEKITLIIAGGFARYFYGIPRFTEDIDAEIHCSEETYELLLSFAEKEKILLNVGEDISRWGLITLPEGYRERAITVMEEGNVTVKVLEEVDYVLSKLSRGTAIDEEDALEVCRIKGITPERIRERMKKMHLPRDPETRFFLERMERFLQLLSQEGGS